MEEATAQQVVERLRARGSFAHVHPVGVYAYSVRIVIPDGREAIWDADGAAGLEAVVLRDGVLVGMVEQIPGSEDFDTDQVVDAIASADYDAPLGSHVSAPALPASGPERAAPEPAGPTASAPEGSEPLAAAPPNPAGRVRGQLLRKLIGR